jgi:hypothetical protein
MYLLSGFCIVVIKGNHKFAAISDMVVGLPTTPSMDSAAALQHCGLMKRNIRFLKEKIHSLHHSLPFERMPGIMVVHIVLHIVKFVNGFPRTGGVKHFAPGEIMTNRHLLADVFHLGFGTYCQVAKNVEPRNSLAPCTRAAILLGHLVNSSSGQILLALDTGHTITKHQWVVLPMPPAVIARVNLLGKAEPSILTFADWQGREIGDYPQDPEPVEYNDASIVDYIDDILPAVDAQDDTEISGVVTKPASKPTGVEVDPADAPQETYFDDGLGQQDEAIPPIQVPPTVPLPEDPALPSQGLAARNARVRKPPKKYIPSMKGNKYAVAMTQIVASLKDSNHAMAMAQMSVKLMSPGLHRQADIVGMIMAQISMKAAIKKWGDQAKFAILKQMKQLHWHNLYKPIHWHALTKKQKEQVLESHIFVEEKRGWQDQSTKIDWWQQAA